MLFIKTGSVIIGVIHTFAFCPKTGPGIFVMIADASIFISTEGVADGKVVSIKAGAVKVLGAQSSKKNPIVLATGGSTGGVITTPPPPVVDECFLQPVCPILTRIKIANGINDFVFID